MIRFGVHSLRLVVPAFAAVILWVAGAQAWVDLEQRDPGAGYHPDGIHILDGSYVMMVNQLQMNITNHGLIGSQYTETYPYSKAPSGQWPAGSGIEYLWSGGLWIGGIIHDDKRVSTGQYERELRPGLDIWSTIYEARNGEVVRPSGLSGTGGRRIPDPDADDDGDGWMDEERLNGRDDDGDGLIEEDFGQIGEQMLVCEMYDNTRLASELYPDHEPLNVKVTQTALAFDAPDYDDFVVLDYEVTNIGTTDIEDPHLGFFADCDIGPRGVGGTGMNDATGFFRGIVRSANDNWANIHVGYMHDTGEGKAPGWFGVVGLGGSRFSRYRFFKGNRAFEFGGLPAIDDDRYEAISRTPLVNYSDGEIPGDYSFLMSRSAGQVLPVGGTARLTMALVAGGSLEELVENCANADVVMRGAYFDLDEDPGTGTRGRETHLCFQSIPGDGDPIYQQRAMHMQGSCVRGGSRYPLISPSDFEQAPSGLWCLWVNYDNCDECTRLTGRDCTSDSYLFWQNWNCWDWRLSAAERKGCTGIAGRETRVPWFESDIPPPSPDLRVWARDNAVHIFWNDDSEHEPDFELEMIDFESYRIWRADNWDRPPGTSLDTGPGADHWQMIAEYDLVNDMLVHAGQGHYDTVGCGQNTGLEVVAYRPACLGDPAFEGLATAMQDVVNEDVEGLRKQLPLLRDGSGNPVPGLEALLPWEWAPTVLDTFFMVAAREEGAGVTPKRGQRFYEYVDTEAHNGFVYFYSVTAADRVIEFIDSNPVNRGYGTSGAPNASFLPAFPATAAQTAADRAASGINIYVYPDPATREALAEFQEMHPNGDDPTGVRIAFANLPESRNRIRIYTASGDLVKELNHDGTDGSGQAYWNLVSRNGQEVVSGIYLYSVESEDGEFEDFRGRFVVIR